ncbi:MAG TPA: penicillin-binding protein activator [Rhizobiaceae bacterium]|nr:penicillin-binding protein activator [Rhizobiaceae bacterium]
MSAIIKARTAVAACCILSAMMLVAGCQSTDLGIDSVQGNAGQAVPTPNPAGEVHGTAGKTRITMMLPKSAAGNGAVVANEVRNGALLAMKDFGNADMELVIKDDTGQAAGAQAAASEAVREGSTAILGPVFAANVTAAAGITLPAGRTMIAFSTDTSNARRGVYLLSYTPQEDTRRIIEFTLSRGTRSIIAFLPSNAEGSVRETVLRQIAGTAGASVQVIRYDRSAASIEEAVKSSAAMMATADTIYIPEGGEIPNAIALMFRRNTIDIVGKQILGSGAWESVVFKEAQLEGALYAGRDLSRFADFAARYQATYGNKPNVWAALGYDSITLSVSLIRTGRPDPFNPQALENPSGFAGINGIFRLRADGTAERGLAIYQVERNAGKLVVPAPTSFSRSGS